MKIKTNQYGVFYKDKKKWTGPIEGELLTDEEIVYNSSVEDESAPIEEHIKFFLKGIAKAKRKKVKLFRQVWKSVKS
jgi:hypothetical protein